MRRIIGFGTDLVSDGYKVVGIVAPILSLLFLLAKALEWPVKETIDDLSQAWALLPIIIWFFIAYFRRWQHSKLLEEALKPKINVDWRFSDQKKAELIIWNASTKTITGIDVLFANYRKADGTGVVDILRGMVSNDGKRAPMSLNPNVPTYFSFAKLAKAGNGSTITALTYGDDGYTGVPDVECGVKFTISGEDIVGCPVLLRVKRLNDETLSMEAWEPGKPAVGAVG